MTITLADKISVLKRELHMRRTVYPRRVAERRMTQEEADWQIAVAEAILADYLAQQAKADQMEMF